MAKTEFDRIHEKLDKIYELVSEHGSRIAVNTHKINNLKSQLYLFWATVVAAVGWFVKSLIGGKS